MDTLLIFSYYVAVLTGYRSARQIFLDVGPEGSRGPSRQILLSFLDGTLPVPNFDRDSPELKIYFPLRDFDDIYRILRTEKPAYIQIERPEANFEVRIGTFAEPLGEGTPDTSA
jgi:hypothetical protein